MNSLPRLTLVREKVRAFRPQLAFCLRATVSALVALAVSRSLNFPLHGLWMVLTAVVVSQVSVGGSLRATLDYLVGTLVGAAYAAAVGVTVPHATALGQAVALALAVAPLAFVAALIPSFRVAPFSAVLVLLIGGVLGESPIASAGVRVLEVALGGVVAAAVSMLVFPERAHELGREAASRILRDMANLLPAVLAAFTQSADLDGIRRRQTDLGGAVAAFDALTAEARRERMVSLRRDADPAALSRTLLRLLHDFVILIRAAAAPLPDAVAERLHPTLARFGRTGSEFLLGCADELSKGKAPRSLESLDAALQACDAEIAALRADGLTRPLSTADVERLFALGFALEQFFHNACDLKRRVEEYSAAGAA
ncbi:MAG: FUSC family protein [Hyphomicrobiales bacterium]|nr:FUSC family protein [Hyphomicrobiales bacterium]